MDRKANYYRVPAEVGLALIISHIQSYTVKEKFTWGFVLDFAIT